MVYLLRAPGRASTHDADKRRILGEPPAPFVATFSWAPRVPAALVAERSTHALACACMECRTRQHALAAPGASYYSPLALASPLAAKSGLIATRLPARPSRLVDGSDADFKSEGRLDAGHATRDRGRSPLERDRGDDGS